MRANMKIGSALLLEEELAKRDQEVAALKQRVARLEQELAQVKTALALPPFMDRD